MDEWRKSDKRPSFLVPRIKLDADWDIDWKRLKTLKSREEDIYLGNLGLRGRWRVDRRFTVLGKNDSRTLVIYNVTMNDSAYYLCIDYNGFGHRRFYILNTTICVSTTTGLDTGVSTFSSLKVNLIILYA